MHAPSETNSETEWQSKSRRKDTDTLHNIDQAHRALYERVEASVSFGFAAIQRALVDLQLQLQIKLRQLMEQQENILQTQSPSPDAITEFEENVKKIDRSLESFTAHADNLSHIKLTLARAAAFVSPEGNLAQLVTKVGFVKFSHTMYFLCELCDFFFGRRSRSEDPIHGRQRMLPAQALFLEKPSR